jgi:DNA-binding CsgD family transcriptional regulator
LRSQFLRPSVALLSDTLDLLSGTGDDIYATLAALGARLGFDYFSLAISTPVTRLSKASAVVRSNYLSTWQERYERHQYSEADVLIRLGRTARLPFLWGSKEDLTEVTPSEQNVLEEAREFKLLSGISIPTYGPFGELMLLTLAINGTKKTLVDLVRESYNLLWMIAPQIQEAVLQSQPASGASHVVTLTAHERICLLWTLRGKSSWEISRIISRSKPTVEYHLQKAMRKFGVTTKIQAAVQAMEGGLIQP